MADAAVKVPLPNAVQVVGSPQGVHVQAGVQDEDGFKFISQVILSVEGAKDMIENVGLAIAQHLNSGHRG